MRLNSLAVRLVLGAAVWSVAALIAGGLVLSSLFRDHVEQNFDERLEIILEGLVAASAVTPGGLALARRLEDPRFEQPYSGWYWQIAVGDEVAERSRSLWDQALPRRPEPDGQEPFVAEGPLEQRLRAIDREIRFPGVPRPLLYTVAGDPSGIEEQVRRFNATLFWSLGVLGVVLVAAVLIQVLFGLQPLRRLRRGIADIRTGRAERLHDSFPVEIAPLAAELNALLDHNAEVVERARMHVGNLAHALKTPLAVLSNEAAETGGRLAEAVSRQAGLIRRQIDHHLVRARAAGAGRVLGARSDVRTVLDDLVRTLGRIHAARGLEIAFEAPQGASFRGERQDLEEILGNLIDNACKWARARVRVTAAPADPERLRVTVDDDGPGLAPEQRESVLARGTRLDETVPGSGLGLSIARDIAGLYGGGLSLERSPLGGLRAAVTLPRAQ